jgi:hypothetical protein
MSARFSFKQLSKMPPMVKTAAGLGVILVLVGSFAACGFLSNDSDSASNQSTRDLPDWTNDLTKIHRK